MITKDRRNFHAWGYRRSVVAKLERPELQGKSMAEDEFAYTTEMIRFDLSNFSAWHYRSQLIPKLLDERGADDKMRAAFLDNELSIVREALNVGPEDQSLWFYHSFLISHIVDHRDRQTIAPASTMKERIAYLRCEIDDIEDLLEDCPNIKWIYEGSSALERLGQRVECGSGGASGPTIWLAKVRALDPMRTDRWNDLERDTRDGELLKHQHIELVYYNPPGIIMWEWFLSKFASNVSASNMYIDLLSRFADFNV